ncbi:hypothetical protein V1J52_21355 [Streptomyces sp. TRM 70351]|uniref:hypothetical protein n=1 Tax=Streptomyces sp. TRM 70351 TaxID=3116552 RepID=UPI002E7AC008|nr:hypothetical protein [Streptomyces sp. TRM 70351]MEE1930704.1 hypothetical protein [Streptomyces sp. TRM 70351]
MRRTTRTLLLAAAALAGASGCVSVPAAERDHPPAATPAPVRPASPPALTPSAARETITEPRRRQPPAALAPRIPPAAGGPGPRPAPSPSPEPPPAGRRLPQQAPPVPLPDPVATAARGRGACELGEAYGGWSPGGELARLCRDVYGG